MRTITTTLVEQQNISSITCNRCEKTITVDDMFEFQEAFIQSFTAGYGSVLGDGNVYEIELCQQCVQEVLGPYLQLKGNSIWNFNTESNKERVICPDCNGVGVFGPPEDQIGCGRCLSEGRIRI